MHRSITSCGVLVPAVIADVGLAAEPGGIEIVGASMWWASMPRSRTNSISLRCSRCLLRRMTMPRSIIAREQVMDGALAFLDRLADGVDETHVHHHEAGRGWRRRPSGLLEPVGGLADHAHAAHALRAPTDRSVAE